MLKNLYAIKDTKMGYYEPFCDVNNNTAIRKFNDLVDRDDSILSRHPEDYELFSIGSYETDTGKIISDEPHYLVKAIDFIKVTSNEK